MDSLTNQQMSYLHSIIFILKHTKCHITADIKKFTFYNIYIKTLPPLEPISRALLDLHSIIFILKLIIIEGTYDQY